MQCTPQALEGVGSLTHPTQFIFLFFVLRQRPANNADQHSIRSTAWIPAFEHDPLVRNSPTVAEIRGILGHYLGQMSATFRASAETPE